MTQLMLRPIYVVLFSEKDWEAEYAPVLTEIGNARAGTFPHQLDLAVVPALAGLHFAQRLPKSLFELGDFPAQFLLDGHKSARPHAIRLMPVGAYPNFKINPDAEIPMLTIVPDDEFEGVALVAESLGFRLPTMRFSELSSGSLQRLWAEMQATFLPNSAVHLQGEHLLDDPDPLTPASLPLARLYRQMGHETRDVFPWPGSRAELLREAFSMQRLVSAIGSLERQGVASTEAETLLQRMMTDKAWAPKSPLTLAFPGVAPAHLKNLHKAADTVGLQLEDPGDPSIEESVISFIATQRTMAEDAVGVVCAEIPKEMFSALADLEDHWTGSPKGWTIKKLLARMNKAAEPLWTDDIVKSVHRASSLSVLSNFPMGILTLPGDTSPLCCRLPISYNAMLPLTRTLQTELSGERHVDLTAGFKVLVAECVSGSDPVGKLSRIGWASVKAMYRGQGTAATVELLEIDSVEELRAAIASAQPDILVLSAHGFNTGNAAGIVIGNESVLAQELGELPPVVIMSACHVSPRGRGEVSIVDLLGRQGALAVLGTQVPVDVRRNALLMGRFFLYLNEVIAGRGHQKSVLEVWQHVQCLNAVNDIAASSSNFGSWIMGPHPTGVSVLEEFMNAKSVGRIRGESVYEDTERLLLELAEEQGIATKVREWMTNPGYIPESLFYNFMGRPGNVWLRPPMS